MTIAEFLDRFPQRMKSGDQWKVKCPAHDDRTASLGVGEGDKGIVLTCYAGCSTHNVLAAMGLRIADLFPLRERPVSRAPITVAEIATAKGLPVTLLQSNGWRDDHGNIVIAYRDAHGKETRAHVRTALRAKDGSRWAASERPIVPYGLWRLDEFRTQRTLAICEGETDTLTLWHVGKPAIGVPGASMVRSTLKLEHLRGFSQVLVFRDNDNGAGEKFSTDVANLAVAAGIEKVQIVAPPTGCKDVNDWYRRNPEAFVGELQKVVTETPMYLASPPVTVAPVTVADDDEEPASTLSAWPRPIGRAAHLGIFGDIVDTLAPETEADAAALLLLSLTMFGNVIGRTAHFRVGATEHYLNLFVVQVGASSKGRKGTAENEIVRLFREVNQDWVAKNRTSGLSSGEGLISLVRDRTEKLEQLKDKTGLLTGKEQMVVLDPGVADKRLFVSEGEFANTLKVMGREGNTLSPHIRKAWDGHQLRVATKNSPLRATDAHISIVGSITAHELRRLLGATESGNGFGNRFLWVCVRRSKALPDGGAYVDTQRLCARLQQLLHDAESVGEMRRDPAARDLWHRVYSPLSAERPGLLGAITGRAEAQVMRLACLFALGDAQRVVGVRHLEAALEVWRYCEESAAFVFGDTLGDSKADSLLAALKAAGDAGLTRSDITRDVFHGHVAGREVSRILEILQTAELAVCRQEPPQGTGRPAARWFCQARTCERSEQIPPGTEFFRFFRIFAGCCVGERGGG
jgi:hypothetical protein